MTPTATLDLEEPLEDANTVARNTGMIPRATIDAIVALRNAALDRCRFAHQKIAEAEDAIAAAQKAIMESAPEQVSTYTFGSRARNEFLASLEPPHVDNFMKDAREMIDTHVWSYIIHLTDMHSLMDRQEKDSMRKSLQSEPPEVTVDNVHATLSRFLADADTIWKRGLANTFAGLDRRFRSHNGWRFGSRIILDRVFDEYGCWSYRNTKEDFIIDAERAFFILSGQTPPPNWYGLVDKIRRERQYGQGPRQSTVTSMFFKINIYKNGNCHLWFTRDDLVKKANRILAEYYGEVLSDGDAHEPEDTFASKTSLARNFGHYPTPESVARRVVEAASIRSPRDGESPSLILEPSAGGGNIALLAAQHARVDCIEIQPHLADALRASGCYRNVWTADFLDRTPNPSYDYVLMNPPFDRDRDVDHVTHALEFLKPDGLLIAVMSAGTEFRETAKCRAFRDRMAKMKAQWKDLPIGAFSSVGTNVNTLLLKVYKDGRAQSRWW